MKKIDRRTARLKRNAKIRAANKAKGKKPSPYPPLTTYRMGPSSPWPMQMGDDGPIVDLN